ncbi:outer membrane protein assembly factor BamD [Candidatus Parabeggiatoa sp. HSG14]|uniref:outer membrane protein assembly factor BamD n=1 Tax=Candidatus Parabeggiatoa sp. HSG14 TaxID=3055593 RepID=UPI0025A6F551|nr:outer membrane protein assembly factor BamD [Thiotrichales bacterium HSG14]
MKSRLSLTLYILLLSLSGCSIFSEIEDRTAKWSADQFYTEAKEMLEAGDYETAIKYYELLEARYPFGKYAQQAQLDIIYAYYKYEEPESAIVAADHFIKLYPRHPKVDYVYYLKGLVNFNRDQGVLDRLLPLDRSQREQSMALDSFYAFAELIERFPKSKYSKEARQRMLYLRNTLANSELHVARFYMKREAYVAAVNRAKTVVESYQRTPAVPEALVILAKAYKIMGLNDLSDNVLKVLKLNYPDNEGITEVIQLVVK